MARLVFGMNQSLDGYVDHTGFAPSRTLFRHFVAEAQAQSILAKTLTDLGLVDEDRIYVHPVVLGHGTSHFAGPRPPLRLASSDRVDDDAIRLTYVPT